LANLKPANLKPMLETLEVSTPPLPIARQVWLQAVGRGLYQFGSAILLFYMPIVFVNYGNMSASEVGVAIGGGSLVGFVGNLAGGGMTDSRQFGRRKTLVVSGVLAIMTALATCWSVGFPVLLAANILFGLSVGLYWTAADAAIMDATSLEQRHRAFATVGVLDNVGIGLGTLVGGWLLPYCQPATWIFGASVVAFGVFLGLVLLAVEETQDSQNEAEGVDRVADTHTSVAAGWWQAIQDRRLLVYLFVNTQFVTFLALVGVTLPLYFVNFAAATETGVANQFTWGYIALGALLQLPVVKLLTRFSYLRVLMASILIWGVGFGSIWLLSGQAFLGAKVVSFAIFAIATIIYKPTSSAWIANLAPANLRGVYTAIAYQCWSIGYLIGPVLGGWAIDQAAPIPQNFWLWIAASSLLGLGILQVLQSQQTRVILTEPAQ
jgi:MFS family permease